MEVVRRSLFRGCARLHADRCAIELLHAFNAERSRHHEALTVIVGNSDEDVAGAGIPGHRPGGIAREHVDLARSECGHMLRRGKRDVLHFVRIAKHGRSNRTAGIDVEALPASLTVGA